MSRNYIKQTAVYISIRAMHHTDFPIEISKIVVCRITEIREKLCGDHRIYYEAAVKLIVKLQFFKQLHTISKHDRLEREPIPTSTGRNIKRC